MSVRTITGTIRTPTGDPWPDFEIDFTVTPSTYTLAAQYPYRTHKVTTGEDGTFSVELATGISYEVALRSAFETTRSGTRYPPGSRFTVVIPDGDAPITLAELRALNQPPPSVPAIIEIVDGKADREHGHVIDDVEGLQDALDDAGGGEGGPAAWGAITGDITDQDDLQDALSDKADTAALGTAALADADVFATSAQGERADSAVQPGDLADVATSGSYDDLDGIPATFAPSPHGHVIADVEGLQDALDDIETTPGDKGDPGEPGPPGDDGEPGPGVSAGGDTGQVLAKASPDDYDTEWIDPPEGGGGGGGPAAWGSITGDLADQTDVQAALDGKADAGHQHEGGGNNSIVIGSGASTAAGRAIVIGENASAAYTINTQAIAIGRGSQADHTSTIAIGSSALATFNSATALGNSARAAAAEATAVGRSAQATSQRAIAIGRSATSDVADTAVIAANDLDVQRSNGSGETRHALYSPNGTKYWLAVTDDGELTVTEA